VLLDQRLFRLDPVTFKRSVAVLADAHNRVVAYYSLAAGSVEARRAPGRVRRNMPDPIP
jgi:hypothetical protein